MRRPAPAAEHAQAALCGELDEAVSEGAAVDVVRRLPTVRGIGEDVVDQQEAAIDEVLVESCVVGASRLLGVATVDEEKCQRRGPEAGNRR
jgi:hypothetical protein